MPSTTDAPAEADGESGSAGPVISARDVRKEYGDLVAVDDVSLDVERGTVVGLLGPNGAGKTTLIKSMLGLVQPTAGRVEIAGVDVTTNPTPAYRHVAAMLEGARNAYWRLSVRENLAFFARLAGHSPRERADRHEELLRRFDLLEKADEPVNDLSRGMKQKVSLACALARDAEVVFLDEPTLGLDVESSLELRAELRRLVAEESITILLSSHDMDVVADLCDRVVVLQDGRVVADDDVEGLLSLFRTQRYRVLLERDPTAGAPGIAGRESATVERAGDHYRLTLTVDDARAFHDVLGDLLDAGLGVVSVDAVEPDLTEAFLRLTDRDPEVEAAGASRDDPPTGDPSTADSAATDSAAADSAVTDSAVTSGGDDA